MSVDTSLPWPSNIPELKRLEELLRCGICYEFMSTSMVTICSHNYCSLCIRQYLGYKTQCPACFQETTCQQLRNNRLLDEIIALYPSLRDKTARHCQSTKINSISGYLIAKDVESSKQNEAASSDFESGVGISGTMISPEAKGSIKERVGSATPSKHLTLKIKNTNLKGNSRGETPKKTHEKSVWQSTSSTPQRNPNLIQGPSTPASGTSPSVSAKSFLKSPFGSSSPNSSAALTQSGCQSVSGFFSILTDRGGTIGNSAQDDPKVSCPVCNVSIPERNINLHLDACLKRMEEGQHSQVICVEQRPKRKPLPKLVYSLLSEKQMRQKLKEIGLSIQGEKQILFHRHRRYTILYNAECDVADPRPISELLRQVEREEKEEAKGTITKSIFNYDRKTAPEIIEKEQITYLKKNKIHFASLIADVKKRQAEPKRKKENREQTKDFIASEVPGPSTDINKQKGSKLKLNHYISSSENESSDSDTMKDKPTSSYNEKPNSILNFFKNSPQKSAQRHEKLIVANDSENLMSSLVDESLADTVKQSRENSCSSPMEYEERPLLKGKASAVSPTNSLNEEIKELPLTALQNTQSQNIKESPFLGYDLKDENINPSPDIFSASPAGSDCSGASESLLRDVDFYFPSPSDALITGNEDRNFSNMPSHQPESCLGDEKTMSKHSDSEEDTEIIPGRQPESCPVDEAEIERPPSPFIGRRVTLRKTPSASQTNQPDLSSLGPETQVIDPDTQFDPEYHPSQLLEYLDIEDIDFEQSRRPRRSSRKRPSTEEEPSGTRKTRKKK